MQEDIASRLGVSTTPVREALQVLQGEGLVTMDPHRGVIVFRPTAEDVREYYEIRELLETFAIELALKNSPDKQAVEELASLVDKMEIGKDNATWLELNSR